MVCTWPLTLPKLHEHSTQPLSSDLCEGDSHPECPAGLAFPPHHLSVYRLSNALVQGLIYAKCLSTGEGPCVCAVAKAWVPHRTTVTSQ